MSSPHYPRGHGFIDRQIQIIKKLFCRYSEGLSSYQMALCELRATPLDSKMPLSEELLYNRQLRTTFPVIIKSPHNSPAIRPSLQARQDHSWYDAHAKEVKPAPHSANLCKATNWGRWTQAVVKSKAETLQSYVVQTPQGTGETGYN